MCYIYNTAGNISYSNYVFIAGKNYANFDLDLLEFPWRQVCYLTSRFDKINTRFIKYEKFTKYMWNLKITKTRVNLNFEIKLNK